MFEVNGTHVLLLGEKNVPSSPLICTAELSSSFDEIEQVFLCYSLCHLLSNSCFEVTYDEHGDTNKCDQLKGSSSTSHTLSSTLLFQQKTNLTSNVTLLTSKETPYVHNLLRHTSNVTNIKFFTMYGGTTTNVLQCYEHCRGGKNLIKRSLNRIQRCIP